MGVACPESSKGVVSCVAPTVGRAPGTLFNGRLPVSRSDATSWQNCLARLRRTDIRPTGTASYAVRHAAENRCYPTKIVP
jgi:hypothetical protein